MKSLPHRLEKSIGRKRLRRNKASRYPIDQSPLWGLRSIHKLAELIGVPTEELEAVCLTPTYNRFCEQLKVDAKPGKAPRQIQEPIESTLRIHYRLVKHLDSIQRPTFLHSATKKRSHVTNADAHSQSGGAVVLMDIRRFFESTLYAHVKRFFFQDLGCSHDVARLLATVCTADGHLPTGSCISPLLSYFAHRKVFEDIAVICSEKNVVVTLYVDDLTMSGAHASKTLMHLVKRRIERQGLRTHPKKDQLVRPGKPAIITGIVRQANNLRLRNKHHDSIVTEQDLVAWGIGASPDKLRGLMASARSVEPAAADRLQSRMDRLLQSVDARDT